MTMVETCKLEGAALDWAVAQAIGLQVIFQVVSETVDASTHERPSSIQMTLCADVYYHGGDMSLALYSPSTDWSQCGPLIERHEVELCMVDGFGWCAEVRYALKQEVGGCHPQVAVCRAIVSSKLGDTVDVPEALAHG